jgi:hypothetical protein
MRRCHHHSIDLTQPPALVYRDSIGLVALDFVLWIVLGGMVRVTFVIEVLRVHLDDAAPHESCFRIPAHVVAYLKSDGVRKFCA